MDDIAGVLQAARAAHGQRNWPRAHALFTRVRQATGLSPDDLDALGEVSWWLGRVDECLDASEAAFRGHLDADHPRQAVMTALQAAVSLFLRGDEALGSGWLSRAERLLADLPECPEHGYVRYITELEGALDGDDMHAVIDAAQAVAAIGRRHGDANLVAIGVLGEGRALLRLAQGRGAAAAGATGGAARSRPQPAGPGAVVHGADRDRAGHRGPRQRPPGLRGARGHRRHLRPMAYTDMFPPPPEEEEFHPTVVTETLFRDTFDLATARTVMAALDQSTAPAAVVQLRVRGGAMARVPVEATAFAHRGRGLMVNVAAMYEDPDERPAHRAWMDRQAAAPAEGPTGRHVNFLGDDSDAAARAAYPGGAWDRLAAVKRRYDPDNLFRHNVNVPPAERERDG